MAKRSEAELLRGPEDPQRATYLELFFDLAFVFALTRVSQRLVEDLTSAEGPVLTEAGQTVLLLLAVFLIWVSTAVATDVLDPQRPAIQLVVVATMLGSLVMAVALPKAFGDRGIVFATAYVATQFARHLVLLLGARGSGELRRGNVRNLFWSTLSGVPWIAGAFVPDQARGLLWTLAVAVDYTGISLGWPTPGLGRRTALGVRVAASHLAERYQQFFIIALGESILVSGFTFSGADFTAQSTPAFVVSVLTTGLLWRIYFYRAGQVLAEAIDAAARPARITVAAAYTHLLMVAGIVFTAVGYGIAIDHPSGRTRPAWIAAILGGPALFLAGRARFEYAVFGRVSRARVIGLLLLVAIVPAMILASPLVVALAAAVVLAGIAISDAARARGNPPEPPSPPE